MRNSLKRIAVTLTAIATSSTMLLSGLTAQAAGTTAASDTLDRLMQGVTAAHTLVLVLGAGGITGGPMTVTYTGFGTITGTPTATCTAGTATVAVATNVLTVTSGGTDCTGTLTVTGFSAPNPATAGSYPVQAVGGTVTGSFAIAIVTNDQVAVTASVAPTITFNVGAQLTTACDASFAGNGGTVNLGALTVGAVNSSDVTAGVAHICTRVSTNATSGVIVTVRSASALGLVSASVPGDQINALGGPIVAGTEKYGLCADATIHGDTLTAPAGFAPVAVAPFVTPTCTAASVTNVGPLTATPTPIWITTGPVTNGFYQLNVAAAVSGSTRSHNDYVDTLTFVATGTF
jgi:hypothetical protein